MLNRILAKFNDPDTIGIISSFPAKSGEIASGNAISRYMYLLSEAFPKNQKMIIFCERRNKNNSPYVLFKNILVYPSYQIDDSFLFGGLTKSVLEFSKIKDVLIQFEFSIYGGKKVMLGFLVLLTILKLLGKNTSLVLHQVVNDLNELSGHLGLSRGSLKINIYNKLLASFYTTTGRLVNRIIVHEKIFKDCLSKLVKPEKILVIPHAVGDAAVKVLDLSSKTAARKNLGLNKKDKVVGVYGYRSWYKGTDWIIQTVRELSLQYPRKNIKLLVAGGVSPTLKETGSYKKFDRKVKRVIRKADGSVIITGFIREKDVWRVFAASDVMVFPYRTRMSASGAFYLTLAYRKPFLVSKPFAKGLNSGIQKIAFDLNTFSFEQRLLAVLEDKDFRSKVISLGEKLGKYKSWGAVANLYLTSIKSVRVLLTSKDAIEKSFIFSQT